ncbi:transcription initiation factor TFIID subunit 4 isoform X2 [Boleophthalmus pectinirostris]|uniref:transcription initiation factor TFIID subunit 4 isoform X2 n=1 Tax=Boleophthalmus pectinirostris TaxID=150288 RepID=UPI00242F5734|nr:transcription initiation factor TFIID subunit 4 isoform X2 [Boleophthalmus pectinirostris]
MNTNKPAEGSKPGLAETDAAVKIVSSSGAASAVVKVIPSPGPVLKPPSSVSVQPSPTISAPVVVAKMNAPGAVRSTVTQQVTKNLNPGVQISPSSTPSRTLVITVPRGAAATQQVNVAPRVAQTTSAQLPANFQIPPGMMLIRSDSGQLMLVSQQALAQAQQATRPSTGPPTPRLLSPPPTPPAGKMNDKVTVIRMAASPNFQTSPIQKPSLVKVVSVPPKPATVQSLNQPRILTSVREPKKDATSTFSQETLESVKKCKNFLVTLIKLASSDSRSANMANNVRGLVKSLLEGKVEADEFTEHLYRELKSTPQPCLVPFLKKSLPAVRILTPDPQLFIYEAATKTSISPKPTADTAKQLMPPPKPLAPGWLSQSRNQILPKSTGLQSARNFTGTLSMRQSHEQPRPMSKGTSGSYKEDDDINDVASMAGVNLREENAQILTTHVGAVVQSCQDQPFLAPNALLAKILQIGQPLEVTEVGPEVVELVSHAAQEFLRTWLEKLSVTAQHRKNLIKNDWLHSKVSDVRAQLKFLEDMETLRKRRTDEEERERLLRLAQSRAHVEDPEMLLLKQRAKELQQLEQAALQHRETNLAALAAIGPRKKKPLELDGQVCVLPYPGVPRVTRIILRDLLQCMEQDRFLRHSLTLYRAMQ